MSAPEDQFLLGCETHSPDRIRDAFVGGLDPRGRIRGKTPAQWLTEMYTRSDRFPACLRTLLDHGAELEDPALVPVLLDDGPALSAAVRSHPELLEHRTSLVSAFTPLDGASLLHVAAEYGLTTAARTLIHAGAEVDARAAVDEHGMGGHTPLFHTVHSHGNRSEPILRLLLEAGARTDVWLAGLIWGRGFDWETPIFDVTPMSYAQLGLLPQMHRDETHIYANIARLLEAGGRHVPPFVNIPNRYVKPKGAA